MRATRREGGELRRYRLYVMLAFHRLFQPLILLRKRNGKNEGNSKFLVNLEVKNSSINVGSDIFYGLCRRESLFFFAQPVKLGSRALFISA